MTDRPPIHAERIDAQVEPRANRTRAITGTKAVRRLALDRSILDPRAVAVMRRGPLLHRDAAEEMRKKRSADVISDADARRPRSFITDIR